LADPARRKAPARTRRAPRPRRSTSQGSRAKASAKRAEGLLLSGVERALLRRACERYGAQIPAYLISGQAELRLLRRVLRKL